MSPVALSQNKHNLNQHEPRHITFKQDMTSLTSLHRKNAFICVCTAQLSRCQRGVAAIRCGEVVVSLNGRNSRHWRYVEHARLRFALLCANVPY